MNRASLKSLAILTCLWVSTVACARHPQPNAARTVTIAQWGQEKYLIYLPVYVAMEKGLFAKRGLGIKLTFTGNDDATFAAVISGSAAFGVGDPTFTAISQEKGFQGKVVASIVDGVALWGVTNNPRVPVIDKPSQLANLRIGTFPPPSTTYTLIKQLIEETPGLRGTRIVSAPIGSEVALLQARKADIVMELEPAASIAESNGFRVVYSCPRFFGPFAFTGLTTTQTLIEREPDLIQRVVSSIQEAVVASHRNPEIAMEVAKKLFPTLAGIVLEHAVNRMISENTLPQSVAVSDEAWQKALSARIAVGDLKRPQATNLGSERESDETATFTQLSSPAEPRGTRRWLPPSAWPSTADIAGSYSPGRG